MPRVGASGLVSPLYRDFDSSLQRWLTRDPIGEAGGINLYQAFLNSPVVTSDPDGLDNIYNPKAGQNAVPDIVASMNVQNGQMDAGYREGIDPLFMIGAMTVGGMIAPGATQTAADGLVFSTSIEAPQYE